MVLTQKDQKKSSTFHKHPTQLKLDFVPRVLPNAFFQPKLSLRPVPLTAAREPGHGSNLHYLGRRGVLLALLYYCTVRFMSLSACICYINKHSSTLSYISQHTLIESYTDAYYHERLCCRWYECLCSVECECMWAHVCVCVREREVSPLTLKQH